MFICSTEYLKVWKSARKSGVWVRVPLAHSWAIACLYDCGFTCHHAKNDYIMMNIWLPKNEENKMPSYAFHTVGVSGKCVVVGRLALLPA